MNRTFTIDEDIIRRLTLKRDRDEREHERGGRHGHFSPRFWRGFSDLARDVATFAPGVR